MDVFEAVTLRDTTNLQRLIDADPSCVNLQDDGGLPPLYTAARYRNQPAIDGNPPVPFVENVGDTSSSV